MRDEEVGRRRRRRHRVGIRPGPVVYITFTVFSGLCAPSCPADP